VRRPWTLLLLAVFATATLAGCAGAPDPPAPGEPAPAPEDAPAPFIGRGSSGLPILTPVGAAVSDGSEPDILADKAGRYVWIGDTSGGHWSTDNGTTWNAMPDTGLGFALSDGWSLAQDDAGSLYAGVLADNRITVSRSDDGGSSWAEENLVAGVWTVVDRPWIAADGDGEVVLFYVAAAGVFVGIDEHCARSTDGAATFTDQMPVAASPQGGKAFYDAAGRFYFARTTGDLYRFDSTCSGGSTILRMVDDLGVNNMLQGDASGTDVYMAAADGAQRIVLAGSRDGGPVKQLVLSPPQLKANTFATVSAHGGQVAVAWYGSETPGDLSSAGYNGEVRVYMAVVDDFWGLPTIRRLQLTEEPNHRGTICMGGIACTSGRDLLDYFMVDHDIWGGLHVAYVDDTGEVGVRYVHVRPAALSSLPYDAVVQLPQDDPGAAGEPPANAEAPMADFTYSLQGLLVETDASISSDPQGDPLSYTWSWGDGQTAAGVRANHTYAKGGAYVVTVTATDPDGDASRKGHIVEVGSASGSGNLPPTPRMRMDPAQPAAGEAVRFTDTSTDADGTVVKRLWDFGAGRTSTKADVSVSFGEGTFPVRLTVTDDRGAVASAVAQVQVGPAPGPGVEATPASGPVSVTVPATTALLPVAVLAALALLRSKRMRP
jgi:PKD repeat protein